MKYIAKNDFMLVEIKKTEKATFVTLGALDFTGKKVFFADEELVEGLEAMTQVEVEIELTTKTRRVHDRKANDAEFLDVVTNATIKSIKKK